MKKINKKGNVIDILYAVVILFVIAITFITVFKSFSDITISLNASEGINQETKNALNNANMYLPSVFDSGYILFFFGTFLSIAVSAYLIKSNAIFFFISVILIAVFAFVSAVLSNTFYDFVNADATYLIYANDNFPMLVYLLNHYVLFTVIMGFIAIISLYAKIQSQETM